MNNIIKALNLTEGAVLTLEKMADRMEFEAIAAMADSGYNKNDTCATNVCTIYFTCTNCNDVPDCYPRYINCHPYK